VDSGRDYRQEELESSCPASAGNRLRNRRRTATRLKCGVFLFCVAIASNCVNSPSPPGRPNQLSTRDELRIGNPEGIVEGTELGIRQTATALSVESLTQLGADGRAIPKLAESWWWSKDGRQLNVNLRRGVQFHDGTPLTADVAATILREAISRPANRALFTSLTDVGGVQPVGDRQLVFELSQPSAFLPDDLELPLSRGSPAVGTGPYRVVKTEPSQVVLERFPNYYLGVPQIRRVVIRPFDTVRTAWTSLLRGDVDMVTNVPPDAVEFISNDQVRVVSFERRYQYLVAFNSRKPPFNLPIVRRALNTAIDRDALIERVFHGHGQPSTGPLWPRNWAYNTSIASYRFDPGLSMSLLNSVGLTADKATQRSRARFTFTCLIPENFNVIERVALEVQKELYNVGVDMQFEVVPTKEFDTRIRQGRFEAILIDMISGPTAGRSYLFWRSAKHFSGALNVFGYEDPEAERLFDVLSTSTNEVAVRSAFTRFQQVLLEDPPALFLAWNERSRAIRRAFDIGQDSGRGPADPVYSIWRWKAAPAAQTATDQ
jgi:peptide/nickel transport system substrate-binding protein